MPQISENQILALESTQAMKRGDSVMELAQISEEESIMQQFSVSIGVGLLLRHQDAQLHYLLNNQHGAYSVDSISEHHILLGCKDNHWINGETGIRFLHIILIKQKRDGWHVAADHSLHTDPNPNGSIEEHQRGSPCTGRKHTSAVVSSRSQRL